MTNSLHINKAVTDLDYADTLTERITEANARREHGTAAKLNATQRVKLKRAEIHATLACAIELERIADGIEQLALAR